MERRTQYPKALVVRLLQEPEARRGVLVQASQYAFSWNCERVAYKKLPPQLMPGVLLSKRWRALMLSVRKESR